MNTNTYSKVFISYAPTFKASPAYAFELVNEPEQWTERDTRVIFEATYGGVHYAELHIGGEFYVRQPIEGDWTTNPLILDALAAVQTRSVVPAF